ncbi:hypothetical protein OAN58_02700 [Paracoccaceae bacterium]|nr:hypothetical protein [Paracoccaceae bacterium]
MTQNSHLLPSDFGLNSFQELIYQPPKRAGDHLDDLDAFREPLIADLAPMRPHEAVMAENIIMLEWDVAQILMQKRHIARSAIFDEITNQYVKVAKTAFDAEQRLERLKNKARSGHTYASRSSFEETKPFDPHDAKLQAGRVIAQLKSGKAGQITQAQEQIKVDLPSPETVLAAVYETGSQYRDLDDTLADLERRRRRLIEDYRNLQNARAIDVTAAE